MSNLQKLIENNGWMPIEEAPQNGSYFVVKHEDGDFNIGLYEYGVPVVYNNGDYIDGGYGKNYATKRHYPYSNYEPITHYMPLDTPEKLAKIVGVLVDELNKLSKLGNGEHVGNSIGNIMALTALQQAEKIAGVR